MVAPPLDVSLLQIVGYADVLPESARPSIVAPVFCKKDNPDSILVPPYSFSNGRYLCDATEISVAELKSLAHRLEVTLFTEPLAAQRDHELWVDQKGEPQYQSRREARTQLNQIALDAQREAATVFEHGQLEDAERSSNVALLADPKNIDAWAVKMAIADVKADLESQDLLLELIPENSRQTIRARVADLCRKYLASTAAPAKIPVYSPMYCVATVRSNYR
jgi:hypothetical protein